MATDKRSGSRSGPPSSPSLEAGSLRRTGRRGRSPEVWKGLCPRPASLCRPPVEPRPAQGPLQALLRCHLSPFPGPVSCPLSCEDPHHTHLPCENHLNGTSATTPFQKGSQMGFWEVGPQHRLHKIPPTQAPPPGPQGWGRGAGQAGAQGARCPLGSCGRGCWGHLPPPGNQDLRAQRWAACSPPSPRAASPSPGVGAPRASSGQTQTPSPSLSGLVTRRVHLVLELALLSAPGNGPTYGCVFRVNFPSHGGFRRK